MIVVRHTTQARYGMVDQLARLLKDTFGLLARDPRVSGVRVLTDVSGPAFVVEAEFQVASLAVWEQLHKEMMRGNEFASWFARIQPLVDHGRREFFTVVT